MVDSLTQQIISAAIEVHPILKSTGVKRALGIDFGGKKLVDGVKRFSLYLYDLCDLCSEFKWKKL
jgi:hypothetical protein